MSARKYKNPPIEEAVCEFRFEPSEPWDIAVPGLVFQEIQNKFPKRKQVRRVQTGLVTEEKRLKQELAVSDWIQFLREDEKAMIQVSQNLISANRLRPYVSWDDFWPIIETGFSVYQRVVRPRGIRRIGLRYINLIDIPGKRLELKEYFDFYPHYGPKLSEDLVDFFVGVQIPYGGGRDMLKVSITNLQNEENRTDKILLDLDYYLAEPGNVTLKNALGWVKKAHSRIEEAFEGCITEKLRKSFGEE